MRDVRCLMEFRAADLGDFVALYPLTGRRLWKAARVQILSGPSWTLWQNGERQAMCGLHPLHSGILEAWLMFPIGRKPRLAALRYLLDRAATVMPERTIICRIDDSNAAGIRMATLAGFWPVDEFLAGTRIRTWSRPAIISGQ